MSNVEAIVHQQLQKQLHEHQGQGLWVMDENLAQFAPSVAIENLQLLSNRFDIHAEMSAKGWQIHFSDFDFSPWSDSSLDRIYYRVSKEKAVVHHVINQSLRCLKSGGELILLGAKNEGTKTYFDKARKLFGDGDLNKLGKGVMEGILVAPGVAQGVVAEHLADELLDDREYTKTRTIAELAGQSVISKPGQFGWDKLDQGSEFLADHFDQIYSKLYTSTPKVLDLGCGYGYLSLRLVAQGVSSILATDNNAAAITCCGINLKASGVPHQVVADNCAAAIKPSFDLVVCNPPFHQGFSVEGELTERFLNTAARLLAADGQAAFVVNRFIPLERKAQGLFREIETFADNGSFKLVRLAKSLL
ncbi:MAG: methyltransferase [Motiliproteus sp.]|nr:methyltransferase [Motiliproteus sp.]MCW9053179.1 methyltransferase [Motiliproteus sp.]